MIPQQLKHVATQFSIFCDFSLIIIPGMILHDRIIIRLEDMLRPNFGFTLRGNLAVFMRSAILTPSKMNPFG